MPVKAAPVAAPFFLVNDNSVSFTYFPGSTDPGVYGATYNARYQFDLTHFDVNRWGTNFIDFNFQQYGKKDPVVTMYGAQGSEEADALVRNTLSGNAFLGKGFFSNYITKDISLAYGGLFVVVDNLLAPQTHQYDIGAQFTPQPAGHRQPVGLCPEGNPPRHPGLDLPRGDFRHLLHPAGRHPERVPVRLPVHRRSGLQVGAAPRIGDPRAADLPADLAADVVEQLHRRDLPQGHRPLGVQRSRRCRSR